MCVHGGLATHPQTPRLAANAESRISSSNLHLFPQTSEYPNRLLQLSFQWSPNHGSPNAISKSRCSQHVAIDVPYAVCHTSQSRNVRLFDHLRVAINDIVRERLIRDGHVGARGLRPNGWCPGATRVLEKR